jgi:zinc protease
MMRHLRLITVLLAPVLLAIAIPRPAAAMTIDRVVSPGGITVWLVQDHTIPAVDVEFTFRGGGAAPEAKGKEGSANLLSDMLLEGAGDLDSPQFQGRLEDLSIELGFNAGFDSFEGSLKTLTENLDTAVGLLHDALTQPRFDAPDLARVKTRVQTALRRSREEPRTIAGEAWMASAFPDQPYGRPLRGSVESVEALTADDLRAFLRAHIGRDNLVVGAAGDITPEAVGKLVDRIFEGLPAQSAPLALADTTPRNLGQTIVIRRAVPQSIVTFGEAGIKRNDPDFYAATLVNYILGGGGFNSRLTNEVREKRGLAYSVYTYLAPYDHFGLVMGGTATENARVAQSISVLRDVWKKMHDEGPTERELANAKTYLTGSFPLQFDSTTQIARLLVSLQYDNLGIDYIDRRKVLINGVTLADAKRVAQRLLDPARLLMVVVGEPAGMAATPSDKAEPGGSAPQPRPAAPVPTGRGG